MKNKSATHRNKGQLLDRVCATLNIGIKKAKANLYSYEG